MLELRNIDKIFYGGTVNEFQLFDKFSFTVQTGEFVSVIGSNGSGKTTLLNIVGGNLPIERGQIILDGTDITFLPEYKRSKRIGRVFQNPALGTVPKMTVLENLAIAEKKGMPADLTFAVNKKKTEYYKEIVRGLGLELENKMDIPVGMLSGGQRQALSLLMSTLTPVDLLLLDEHTAALDPKTAETIMQLTDKIVKEKKITAIMVSHNLRYAVEYGNRIVMMHKGEIVIDKAGDEKQAVQIADLLDTFNSISIECGN